MDGRHGSIPTANTTGEILISEIAPSIEGTADELAAERDENCELDGTKWVRKPDSDYTSDFQCKRTAALASLASGAAGTSVGYDLEKQLEAVWNMTVGAAYSLNDHWAVRAELGFIDKIGGLVGFEYRFGVE